jgi:hypothetical protein
MGKLHELLAVENDIKDVFTKIVDETTKTFNQKSSHFQETRKKYHPFKADDTDIPDEEFMPMVTTVADKLDYAKGPFIRMIDALLQKERANQTACADLVVENPDGTMQTIIEKTPVIFLVQMENVLTRIRGVYAEIPTFDPAKSWSKDETGVGIWKAEDVERIRTKKVPHIIVKYAATKEHPAQTDLVSVDAAVGKWTHSTKSGALSPKQKSQLLDRIDRLIAGVKIARAKANDLEVEPARIGSQFFNFISENVL